MRGGRYYTPFRRAMSSGVANDNAGADMQMATLSVTLSGLILGSC